MRICHLAKYYAPFRGGIETHVQSIARAQHNAGTDVTVVCINHQDKTGNDVWNNRLASTPRVSAMDGGVKVERFPKFATLARFDFCYGLTQYIKDTSHGFDLFHLHVPNPTLCCALALAKPKIPLVVTYHSDIVKQRFIRKPFRIVENIIFSRASRFIASTAAYADSSQVLKPLRDRVTTIPFGLDLEPYINPSPEAVRFQRQLLEKARGQRIWLCVGRLVYYKGFENAIRALPRCRGRLMLVGTGPLRPSFNELANELGVADRIDWYDYLSDDQLIGAYHAATALWFPSVARSEAFGLVQIEAMASGCPVINTRIAGSGVSSVSLDGVSGLTIEVANPIALADAANRLDANHAFRSQLSAGARLRAQSDFSLKRMVEQTNELYRSLLGIPGSYHYSRTLEPIGR
jgi:rhamnosyl/mannosyltransferase